MPTNKSAASFMGYALDPHNPAAFFSEIGRRTYSMEQTAALCDLSYEQLASQVRDGAFPVKPLAILNTHRFPKNAIDALCRDDSDQPVQ